jgi:polyisoprenoid-binding protein YceI
MSRHPKNYYSKTWNRVLLVLFLAITSFTAKSEAQSFMAEDGYVEFLSRAPMLEFKGISNNLVGLINLDENAVDFYVDLNTLDTGIQLRNRHMRESYLETKKFPFAEFTGTLNDAVNVESGQVQRVSVTGKFKIHGVEREITVNGTLQFRNDVLELRASWEVKLEDHNIDRPRVIFYELSDTQVVTININLKKL